LVRGKAAADLIAYESIKRVARRVLDEIDGGKIEMQITGQMPESVLKEMKTVTAWSMACAKIAQFAKMN